MTQEDIDKLLKNLYQMLEKCDKAISIWKNLMEQGKYPTEDCLEHININNQQKDACLKMIRKYDTRK